MKKRICFAGFGEVELAALQPSLAGLSAAWECVYVPDEATAFRAMDEQPFDAAVVNLSLGGIDANFLHQASIKHPRTLRFVLGELADREMILSCMGTAHQFISRPWKPPELIAIVERSLALDAWLSNDKLRSFIPRLGNLPGLPATYFEVLKKTESPDSSIDSIAEIIAHDPTLTARLLQVVNSPACGGKGKVSSPAEAVQRMGLEAVKALVLCLQVFAETTAAKGASLPMEEQWKHSFNVAKTAANIVKHCLSNERMTSDAYTAGLLHNIGQIVLATNLAKEYSTVVNVARKRKCPVQEIEMELLGVTHNQVGAYLLGLWGLPLPIVEATALHHQPASATPVEFSLVTVIHVADVLAHDDDEKSNGLARPELDVAYLTTLDLPRDVDDWRKVLATKPANTPIAEKPADVAPPPRPPMPTRSAPPKQETRSAPKLLAVMAVAVAALAVMAWKHKAHPGSGPSAFVAPSASGAAASEPSAPAPVAATPAVASMDSVKLQSIIYSSTHPVALINGRPLEVGDHLDDVQVTAINPTSVVLTCKGQTETLSLK